MNKFPPHKKEENKKENEPPHKPTRLHNTRLNAMAGVVVILSFVLLIFICGYW